MTDAARQDFMKRVVYTLARTEKNMNIVIVGMRADLEVYREAARRLGRNS